MAKNFIQPGNTLTIPAPADVQSGGVVLAGSIAGIAQNDAAAGEPCDVSVSGVWELPKVAADAVTVGAPIFWAGALATIDDDEGDNPRLGTAVEAAAASTATVKVRLAQL